VTLLHFISLLLSKIISDKTTTEIVKGFACPAEEIAKNYEQCGANRVSERSNEQIPSSI
jgi:hypothetical protein